MTVLAAMPGWSIYQVGEAPPPPLIAVNHRHFFTDVVIIRSTQNAVAYRGMLTDSAERPPDASEAFWTYAGTADATLAAIFALSNPGKPLRRPPAPPDYQLPPGELRDLSTSKGDPSS